MDGLIYNSPEANETTTGDMSDSEFALRLVLFEYLIPMQRRSRAKALCSSVSTVEVGMESDVMGAMEHLLHLSDALLASRGYPTSFVSPFSRVKARKYCRYNVNALTLAETDEVDIKGRRADPRGGYRIFSR